MKVNVDGFDWDAANLLKNERKHGLTKELIEAFFKQELWIAPDPKHSTTEERYLAVGRSTHGRPMLVIFTLRQRQGLKLLRPISARWMHAREAKRYEEAFTDNEK